MGIAWCRERVEQSQNSKSPVDRILIRCSKVISPKSTYSSSPADDIVYRGMRGTTISHPIPVHMVPPRPSRLKENLQWQPCTLTVPDSADYPNTKTPIPPPRKNRKRRINSLEVLNTQLQLLRQPGYTISSENLLNHEYITQNSNRNSESVVEPLSTRKYNEEKVFAGNEQKRHNRFMKSSGKKVDPHPTSLSNDVRDEKVKNDNTKKAEQKIKVVKNVSTVSLPNYNELVKPAGKVSSDVENSDDKTGNQSGGSKPPQRNSSTLSLPGEGSNSILTSLSEATIHRLETYMKKCRSFGSLKQQQLLERLEEFNRNQRTPSESSDSWAGLDDWDLGIIEHCDAEMDGPPVQPKSRIERRQNAPKFSLGPEEESPNLSRRDSRVPEEWFQAKNDESSEPMLEGPPGSDTRARTASDSSSIDNLKSAEMAPLNLLKIDKLVSSDSNLHRCEKSEEQDSQKFHPVLTHYSGILGKPASSDSNLLKLIENNDESNLLKLHQLATNDSNLNIEKTDFEVPNRNEEVKTPVFVDNETESNPIKVESTILHDSDQSDTQISDNKKNRIDSPCDHSKEAGDPNSVLSVASDDFLTKESIIPRGTDELDLSKDAKTWAFQDEKSNDANFPKEEIKTSNEFHVKNENENTNIFLNLEKTEVTEEPKTFIEILKEIDAPGQFTSTNPFKLDAIHSEPIPWTSDDSPLLKILQEYKEKPATEEIPIPPRRRSRSRETPPPRKKRSSSLKVENVMNVERTNRSPSVTSDKTNKLLEQIQKSGSEIDIETKELIKDVEKKNLYKQLPEDAFEIFIARKKPSLRESLSEFLGFGQEENLKDISEPSDLTSVDDTPEEERIPPPLPASPPPSLDPPVQLEMIFNSSHDLVNESNEKEIKLETVEK